ncbi:hypothetical protein FKW77_008832 [Venturia effusa]|uniref:Uncharacterized protein n=1 Tax=Venturia effusa TaxID=50376 RepID=A0A517L7X5_9PEZI|nr:hypothetical protein FKW77_008832 [Venturia effusa]
MAKSHKRLVPKKGRKPVSHEGIMIERIKASKRRGYLSTEQASLEQNNSEIRIDPARRALLDARRANGTSVTFLTLPSELRQQILQYTFDDDCMQQLWKDLGSNGKILRSINLAKTSRKRYHHESLFQEGKVQVGQWAKVLRSVDHDVTADVDFVEKGWHEAFGSYLEAREKVFEMGQHA